MADVLPSIQVTDPQNKLARPPTASPIHTPTKDEFAISETAGDEPISASDQDLEKPGAKTTSKPVSPIRQDSQADGGAAESRQLSSHSAIDPLSEHIWKRTSPQSTSAQRPRRLSDVALEETGSAKNSAEIQRSDSQAGAAKDKKKAVTFLSRFRANKKKETPEESVNDPDEADNRPKGAEAELFYQSVDNLGFSPRHPQPPGYIKVQTQGKKEKEFNRMFLAQELKDKTPTPDMSRRSSTFSSTSPLGKTKVTNGESATWALEFSIDGKYLATGGQDKVVRIWATLSSREERRMHENDEEAHEDITGSHGHLSAPVFRSKPFRVYEGHTSPVLDLSWSKNNFLLSSSMDKTVRLWHVSRSECLCAFKHTDFVTSIVFHPRDDRFFLAGSLDSKLRLWSIPDKKVAYWNQMPEMCTAVAFTPDGRTAIAGCLTGLCLFYETEGLKYQTQIHVKSTYGKNARGSKITGIQTINVPPNDPSGDVKLLITSNDSRTRLYNFRDKSLDMKFKGNENSSSQIHARFNDDGKYIICGSEDKKVFIWSPGQADPDKKEKKPAEIFEAHKAATTVCAIAPARTRQHLSNSEDPIYDLCNPPPVTLVSKAEVESVHSSRTPDDAVSIQPTPATAEGNGSFKRPEESPAYIARSAHPGGHVIVTADATGCIKVFRQDCAYEKRLRSDTESISKRFSAVGALRRHSSMATQGSSRSRSRKDSNATQPSRERILSWRQSITNTNSFDSPKVSPSPQASAGHTGRSHSPRKSLGGRFSHRSLLNDGHGPARSATLNGTPPMSAADSQSVRKWSDDTGSLDSPLEPTTTITAKHEEPLETIPDAKIASAKSNSGAHAHLELPLENRAPSTGPPSPETPGLDREKSNSYWRYDAWRDAIMNQLQGGTRASPSVQSNAADHGGSSVSEGGSHLGRPRLQSTHSGISSVSLLSDEVDSNPPSAELRDADASAAAKSSAGMGEVRR